MRLEQRLSAAQVASIAIAGSLLLYANVWQAALMHYPQHGHVHSIREFWGAAKWMFARLVPPIILGIWMIYAAQAAFRRGVEQRLWTDVSLNNLSARLDSKVWTVAGFAMALTAAGFVVADAFTRLVVGGRNGSSSAAGFVFFCILPLECLAFLRRTLRPGGDGPRSVWGNVVRPLVSDHWGKRSLEGS